MVPNTQRKKENESELEKKTENRQKQTKTDKTQQIRTRQPTGPGQTGPDRTGRGTRTERSVGRRHRGTPTRTKHACVGV